MAQEGMGMDIYAHQKPEMEEAQTPLLDHLGNPYLLFKERFINYLSHPRGVKRLIIGGRTAEGKTRLATEVLVSILEDERVRNCQHHFDFEYELDYINIGQWLDAASSIGLVKTPKGSHKTDDYRKASENAASIMALSEQVPRLRGRPLKKHIIQIYDSVLTTGCVEKNEKIRGTDRGLDWAITAVDAGGFCVIMNAPEAVVNKGLELRQRIREANLEDIHPLLQAAGIVDTRSPAEIRNFYLQSGTQATRDQQDTDIYYQMCDLIRQNRIGKPSFVATSPIDFKTHPKETELFIREVYLPFWLRMLFGQDNPERGFVFTNDMLPPNTRLNAYGAQLNACSLLPKLDKLTRVGLDKPEILVLRSALQALGAIPPDN